MVVRGLSTDQLKAWCRDALALLPTEGLPASIHEMRAQAIEQHDKRSSLFQIAADLAEGLSHLPSSDRLKANRQLEQKHGFGYQLFSARPLLSLKSAIRRGSIQGHREYEAILRVATDTTLSAGLREILSQLLADHEKSIAASAGTSGEES
jgi:hypothetical protein